MVILEHFYDICQLQYVRSYKSPYIKGDKLGLLWAYIDPNVSGFKYLTDGINKSEIHYETYEFGNTGGN